MLVETADVNQDNHLVIGGCDAVALAARYGTPLLVYDENRIRANCRAYREAFARRWGRVEIAYAAKAFLCGAMVRLVGEEGLGLDVASHGELAIALRHGARPDGITLHGNIKSVEEMAVAVEQGIGRVVIDSASEVVVLDAAARARRRPLDVLVRLNIAVAADTDPKYSTGLADSKFGIPVLDGAAGRAIENILGSRWLRLKGIHFHLGSQLADHAPYRRALHRLGQLLQRQELGRGWAPGMVVCGGGMAAKYTETDVAPPPDAWARAIVEAFAQDVAPWCRSDVILGIEPGRSVVAEAGTTLYTAAVVKVVPLPDGTARHYVIVDGGLSDNPRPLAYGAKHVVVNASAAGSRPDQAVRVSGRHCETDTLAAEAIVAPVEPGAVLAMQGTGAYAYAMSSNYNGFLRPAVVFARDGEDRLVLRRETLEDLMRREPPEAAATVVARGA